MHAAHIFKATSRLGVRRAPHRQIEPNCGVEEGAHAIVTQSFAKYLGARVSHTSFPTPPEIDADSYNETLAKLYGDFASEVSKVPAGLTQVVVGGDHSVTFPSVISVMRRMSDVRRLGYLQFDSHGDIHQLTTSPTGNFHGMYVRALVDTFDVPEIDALVPRKLPTENMLFVGNLDLEPEEAAFFTCRKIKRISGDQVHAHPADALKQISAFISHFDHLHVTFDIDCLDKKDAPATGIPALNGMRWVEVLPLLQEVATHPSLSIDLVEVNPSKPGARRTIHLARTILKTLLNAEALAYTLGELEEKQLA